MRSDHKGEQYAEAIKSLNQVLMRRYTLDPLLVSQLMEGKVSLDEVPVLRGIFQIDTAVSNETISTLIYLSENNLTEEEKKQLADVIHFLPSLKRALKELKFNQEEDHLYEENLDIVKDIFSVHKHFQAKESNILKEIFSELNVSAQAIFCHSDLSSSEKNQAILDLIKQHKNYYEFLYPQLLGENNFANNFANIDRLLSGKDNLDNIAVIRNLFHIESSVSDQALRALIYGGQNGDKKAAAVIQKEQNKGWALFWGSKEKNTGEYSPQNKMQALQQKIKHAKEIVDEAKDKNFAADETEKKIKELKKHVFLVLQAYQDLGRSTHHQALKKLMLKIENISFAERPASAEEKYAQMLRAVKDEWMKERRRYQNWRPFGNFKSDSEANTAFIAYLNRPSNQKSYHYPRLLGLILKDALGPKVDDAPAELSNVKTLSTLNKPENQHYEFLLEYIKEEKPIKNFNPSSS